MIANKNQIFKLAGVVITCAVISACSSSDPTAKTVGNSGTQSSGSADFTKFVAIGDSLTAGYADGALYLLGQQNSFPLMLAQQFAAADGVAVNFTQPLVDDNFGGLLFGGNTNPDFDNRLVLNTETEKPERLVGDPTTEVTDVQTGSFNNMGVPGAKSFHLVASNYGDFAGVLTNPATANPYFVRFASSTTTSVIADAAVQQPSFFILWIGNNDVLGYATSGGDDSDSITPKVNFDGAYAAILNAINTASNKGVLVNIPDVSSIPYFTTVPYNAVPMTAAEAENANMGYADYNNGLDALAGVIPAEEIAKRKINFSEGQNALVILDEDLTDLTQPPFSLPMPSMRQATAEDLIVLPAASIIGTLADPNTPTSVIGVGVPLGDKDVLIPSEIAAIDTARQAFNDTIKAAADNDPNLAFLDAAAIMTQLNTAGIDYGTGSINADFATGGGFSLDGVHPTARGYAVIANSIIDVINTDFSANVYKVDPATYPTIFLK